MGVSNMKGLTTLLLFSSLLSILLLGGCSGNMMTTFMGAEVTSMTNNTTSGDVSELFNSTPAITEPSKYTVTKTEGDLVILAPEAIDPDGDYVTYTFSQPFDQHGMWQTHYGDAGNYTVSVTATDTKGASTTESVRVEILRANRAPSLHCPDKIVAKEGETIHIDCTANDREDGVTLTYFGWMTSDTYTTTYEDAGTHNVTVQATDNAGVSTEQTIPVIVLNANRAPLFPAGFPTELVGEEGDIFTIDTSGVYDPDGDAVTITFSQPFDQDGIWKSELGDAGTHPVDVVASDGTTSVKRTVSVKVGLKNTAPVLQRIPDVTVYEGEPIHLDVRASDREGDPLTTTVTGWMTSTDYTTTYDDAGTYTVKVTVSDGQYSDSQVVHITVIDRNRPPQFVVAG